VTIQLQKGRGSVELTSKVSQPKSKAPLLLLNSGNEIVQEMSEYRRRNIRSQNHRLRMHELYTFTYRKSPTNSPRPVSSRLTPSINKTVKKTCDQTGTGTLERASNPDGMSSAPGNRIPESYQRRIRVSHASLQPTSESQRNIVWNSRNKSPKCFETYRRTLQGIRQLQAWQYVRA